MKQFLSFVRKEICHIFRDTRTLLVLFVMPVVMIILFGFAISTEVNSTRVAVIDPSKDHLTRTIVEHFAANRYFTITHQTADMAAVNRLFRQGDIDMAVCFSEDFATSAARGEAAVQLLLDGMEPNQASIRSGYAQQLLAAVKEQQEDAPVQYVALPTRHTITTNVRMLYNPQQKSEYNFVPGVIGMIILLLCTLMTSIAIVREKENGTMEVLLASPLPPITIILAKLVPYLIISIVNLVSILLLSRYLLHMPFAGSLPMFLLVALVYILVALSLGLFISTCVSSQLAAMLLSLLVFIPTVYFSGMVFAIESMPEVVQHVSKIVPARWFMDAARKLMVQGVESRYVVGDLLILTVMLFTLLTVSLKLFKTRL